MVRRLKRGTGNGAVSIWKAGHCGQFPDPFSPYEVEGEIMIWTIAVVLLVLWLLGLVALPAVGSLIHLLLVLAVIVVAVNLIQGRRGRA